MTSKLSQIIILLAAVTATFQRKLVSDDNANIWNDEAGLRDVLAHLQTHAHPKSEPKPYSEKQRIDPSGLLNIQTLNLILKSDKARQELRSRLEQENRMCPYSKKGICMDTRDEDNEVNQILDELENEFDKDPLRCDERCAKTGRCGCKGLYRSGDRQQERETQLRCKYGRCGKQRNEVYRTEDREEDEESLRCRFGRCGGKYKSEANLRAQLEQYGKKYQISDDLDAIVVDISNFKGLHGKLNGHLKTGQTRNVDMDYMYGDENDREDDADYNLDTVGQKKDEDEDLVNRVVSDLLYKSNLKPQQEDKDPIRPNELADFFEAKKRRVVGNALNFVRNSRGSKDLTPLSKEQKYQLQRVRAQVQRLGAQADLKQVEEKVLEIILGDGLKSEVLPHNEDNNNVYIPRWVYTALRESRDDLRSKRMLPLTKKQKNRFYNQMGIGQKANFVRRQTDHEVKDFGVPFQLQVQGLGLINPNE